MRRVKLFQSDQLKHLWQFNFTVRNVQFHLKLVQVICQNTGLIVIPLSFLSALIAGGAVGLVFAVFLILLLVYRMKKKDEGSYDLGKKPIYKKAPTTEVYA